MLTALLQLPLQFFQGWLEIKAVYCQNNKCIPKSFFFFLNIYRTDATPFLDFFLWFIWYFVTVLQICTKSLLLKLRPHWCSSSYCFPIDWFSFWSCLKSVLLMFTESFLLKHRPIWCYPLYSLSIPFGATPYTVYPSIDLMFLAVLSPYYKCVLTHYCLNIDRKV